MTTSNKNFKVKNGLEVLGTFATVDGNEVLTSASNIEDLSNVNIAGIQNGNTLVFNQDTSTFIPGTSSGGGSANIIVSDTQPQNQPSGTGWLDSSTGNFYVFYQDDDSSQWIQTAASIGPAGPEGPQGEAGQTVEVSANAPQNPEPGDGWLDSSTGNFYVFYEDQDSSQWIQTAAAIGPAGPAGPAGADGADGASGIVSVSSPIINTGTETSAVIGLSNTDVIPGTYTTANISVDSTGRITFAENGVSSSSSIVVSETEPEDPSPNDLWYNSSNGALFVRYEDIDSLQWVQVGANGAAGESGIVASSEPPEDTSVLWLDTSDEGSVGLAIGGTEGQVLAKVDSEDFNTEWIDNSIINLSDTNIDSPDFGDILEYDGTSWVKGQRATTGKAIAMSIVFG